jgi:hypothetical protein
MTLPHKSAYRRGSTQFVALPVIAQRPIEGGCDCRYCKAHPNRTPKWDTLAFVSSTDAWTVHFPDLAEKATLKGRTNA